MVHERKTLKVRRSFNRKRQSHTHDLTKLYNEAKRKLKLPYETTEYLGELPSYYTQARYPNAGLARPRS